MKLLKRLVWALLCAFVFFAVFGLTVAGGFLRSAGLSAGSFTLQSEADEASRYEGAIEKTVLDIPYITDEGVVEVRSVVLYRPADAEGNLPLIFIPHYAAEETSAEFHAYLSHGWAVASPIFREQYNGELTGNDLVFNNAALYALRHLDGIDADRIAVVGGSAGGYMALMLSELQMGTCATIANSPIANVYYNLVIHFAACDEVNRDSGFFDIPIPIQLLVSKSFRANLGNFPDPADAERWATLSPLGQVLCISSPVVINHFTGDILVPVDQISKRFSYAESDGTLPEGFPVRMAEDYPGILSRPLEEEAVPEEVEVRCFAPEGQRVDMTMPYSARLLTINIFDDGPMSAKGSHTAPGTSGSLDTMPYLEEMLSHGLAATEQAVPEKLALMLRRYLGKSSQLPAHEGVDDEVYGSLAVYRAEVIEELARYVAHHSLAELEARVTAAIAQADDAEELTAAWREVRQALLLAAS